MKAMSSDELKGINEAFVKWQAPASEALDWLYRTGRITSEERNSMAFRCLQAVECDDSAVRFPWQQEMSVWDYADETEVPKIRPDEVRYIHIDLFNKKKRYIHGR